MFLDVTQPERSQPIKLSELAKGRQAAAVAQQHFAAKKASEQRRRSSKFGYNGPKSAMLGRSGLALVASSLAVLTWTAVVTSPAVTSVLLAAGYTGASFEPDLLPQMLLEALGTSAVVMNVASWAGTVGWLVSIAAAISDRGRRPAAVGIVVGMLAPLIVMVAFMVAVWVSVAAG